MFILYLIFRYFSIFIFVENTEVISNPDISLQFRVFLKNAQTGAHTQESRTLRFWFKPDVLACEHSTIAQHLFKDVVCPTDFPRGKLYLRFEN